MGQPTSSLLLKVLTLIFNCLLVWYSKIKVKKEIKDEKIVYTKNINKIIVPVALRCEFDYHLKKLNT